MDEVIVNSFKNKYLKRIYESFFRFLSIVPLKNLNIVNKILSIIKLDLIYWERWVEKEKINRGTVPILFEKLISEGEGTALDVGSGNGFYYDILNKNGYDVTCLDRCEKGLEIVKNRGFKAKKIDIKNFSMGSKEHYDIISCMGVLHHIIDDNSVKNAVNVMKDHCDLLILGIRNDFNNTYKTRSRSLSFYSNLADNSTIIKTDSYLDILTFENRKED